MIYIWSIVIYLVFLIGISVYKSRMVKKQEDFMVATPVRTGIGTGSLFGGAGRVGIAQAAGLFLGESQL